MTANPVVERLLAWAASKTWRSLERVRAEVEHPTLEGVGWAECLDDDLFDLWPTLSTEARIVAFAFAFCLFRDLSERGR